MIITIKITIMAVNTRDRTIKWGQTICSFLCTIYIIILLSPTFGPSIAMHIIYYLEGVQFICILLTFLLISCDYITYCFCTIAFVNNFLYFIKFGEFDLLYNYILYFNFKSTLLYSTFPYYELFLRVSVGVTVSMLSPN